jgi:hypothetical protein
MDGKDYGVGTGRHWAINGLADRVRELCGQVSERQVVADDGVVPCDRRVGLSAVGSCPDHTRRPGYDRSRRCPVSDKEAKSKCDKDSKDEIEARADMLKAEKELIEARKGFLDRLVMRGVIPLALVVAAPAATYYFSRRADDGIAEVRRVSESIGRLDEVIEGAKRAADKISQERAAEFVALRAIVSRLQWTIVVGQARDAALTIGRPMLARSMSHPGVSFDTARQAVEDALYAHLAPRVDSDPKLLREAIRGAVDELRPPSPGLDVEPRFPAKSR